MTDGPDRPDRPDRPDQPEVGSVGEEAAKLFGALSAWVREGDRAGDEADGEGGRSGGTRAQGLGEALSSLADHAAAAVGEVDEHLATGSAECTYCPICRTVHLVRQTTPEVRAHLATAASSLLRAAAGLLATAPDPQQRPGAAFERIDLDEGADDEPGEPGEPDEPDEADGPGGRADRGHDGQDEHP